MSSTPSYRATLAFVPPANPTYVPLGLASLAPFVRGQAPGCALDVVDLNIEAWHLLAQQSDAGRALLSFMVGRSGDSFFDPAQYIVQRAAWSELAGRLARLGRLARRYVETGEEDPELGWLLGRLVDRLLRSDPELVGLSVVFPDQVAPALALARRLRAEAGGGAGRSSGPRIVLGGAMMTALQVDQLLQACDYVDAVLPGEGEHGAARLCAGDRLDSVPGLIYRDGATLRVNPAAAVTSLRFLPAADFSDLPLSRYLNPTPVLPVLFSRGCRWRRCRFCAHSFSFSRYRHKAHAAFVDELQGYVERHGARHFYLADQYIEARDLEGLALELEGRGLQVAFHAMGRPTADFTPELLVNLRRGGCRWISWGVESGSPRLLELMDKGIDLVTVERVLIDAAGAGISNLVMLIFGMPTSTEQDLALTLRLVEAIHPSADALTASSFVLFAGTPFAAQPKRYGIAVGEPQTVLAPAGRVAVHSHRLAYQVVEAGGALTQPRGPAEVQDWQRRAAWLPALPFVDGLCAEHYLLYVSASTASQLRPLIPFPSAA